MQVAKSITVKVSKRINRDKFLSLRNFFNTYQTIARLYYSYILENSLEEKLISGEITAKDLKNILHQKLYRQIRESFGVGSQTAQEIRDVHTYNADFNASANIGIRAMLPNAKGCVNHP